MAKLFGGRAVVTTDPATGEPSSSFLSTLRNVLGVPKGVQAELDKKVAAPTQTTGTLAYDAAGKKWVTAPAGGGSTALGNTVSVLQAADGSWPARPDTPTVFAIGAKGRTQDPPGWLTENDVYVEA